MDEIRQPSSRAEPRRAGTVVGARPGRARLLASSTAFALACLLMVTVHELAHGVVGAAQGASPVVHAFSVEADPTPAAATIVRAMAGPAFSLVSGLALLAVPWRPVSPFWALVWWWSGLLSVQEFSGYLITGPFVGVGDVGASLAAADAPGWLGWLGFVVGWVLTALTGRTATRRLTLLTTADGDPWPVQLRQLGLLPWLLGSLIAVVASAGVLGAGGVGPSIVVFEASGVLASGLFVFFVRAFMGGAAGLTRSSVPVRPSVVGLVVLVVVAVGRQVVLGDGLPL